MDWQIQVRSPALVSKAVYTKASPAGIVNTIQFSIEPSGNCLNASFDAIPSKVNIAPRDIIEISVDGTLRFVGYVNSYTNAASNKVATFQVEGLKKLLYEVMVDVFWMDNANHTLISMKSIVTSLFAKRPSFISATLSNNASEDIGWKPPLGFDHFFFGQAMDDIAGGGFDWGVNAQRQLFIKPSGTGSALNLNGGLITYDSHSSDKVVTAVLFKLTPVNTLRGAGLQREIYANDYASGGNTVRKSFNQTAISYEYVDAAASTYGKFTQVVDLPLSDSWLEIEPVTALANYTDFKNQADSTSTAAAITSLSTTGTGTYVTNTSGSSQLVVTKNADQIVGLEARYRITTGNSFSFSRILTYSQGSSPSTGFPVSDTERFTVVDTGETVTATQRFVFPNRATEEFLVDPETLNSNGQKVNRFSTSQVTVKVNSAAVGSLRLYYLALLKLNSDALDELAKTFVRTPAQTPSMVEVVGSFPGIAYKASYESVETPIKSITVEISRKRGFVTSYALGDDKQRNNPVIDRILDRAKRG